MWLLALPSETRQLGFCSPQPGRHPSESTFPQESLPLAKRAAPAPYVRLRDRSRVQLLSTASPSPGAARQAIALRWAGFAVRQKTLLELWPPRERFVGLCPPLFSRGSTTRLRLPSRKEPRWQPRSTPNSGATPLRPRVPGRFPPAVALRRTRRSSRGRPRPTSCFQSRLRTAARSARSYWSVPHP